MKSVVVKRVADQPPKFPCLMVNANAGGNTVVLMQDFKNGYYRGAVVAHIDSTNGPSAFEIGYYSHMWNTVSFEPFDGVVQLEND